jgi:hypothetical protein
VPRWTAYVRSPQLEITAQIDDFDSLELRPKHNDVGAWVLDLDGRLPVVAELLRPGAGIVVTRDDQLPAVLSGPVVKRHGRRTGDTHTVTLSGLTDDVWLRRRLAHPQPATDTAPYSTAAYDVRTGIASTVMRQYVDVNAAAGAILPRRVLGLALGGDLLIGGTVTGRGRWQTLLELLQELALAADLGFRVRQNGATLQFDVYAPTDRSASVRFSDELGNLGDYEYDGTAPTCNYPYVGGGGEGTARVIHEAPDSASIVDWQRIESFVDRRDTTAPDELSQAAEKATTEGAATVGMSLTPIDTPDQRFGQHYDLGDRVSAVLEDVELTEVLTEVRIVLNASGQQVLPTVGVPDRQGVLAVLDKLARLDRRMTNVERR